MLAEKTEIFAYMCMIVFLLISVWQASRQCSLRLLVIAVL